MTVKELINSNEYLEHHTSLYHGYMKVKSGGVVKEYNGKFGKGYVVLYNNPASTRYCFITYYIEK